MSTVSYTSRCASYTDRTSLLGPSAQVGPNSDYPSIPIGRVVDPPILPIKLVDGEDGDTHVTVGNVINFSVHISYYDEGNRKATIINNTGLSITFENGGTSVTGPTGAPLLEIYPIIIVFSSNNLFPNVKDGDTYMITLYKSDCGGLQNTFTRKLGFTESVEPFSPTTGGSIINTSTLNPTTNPYHCTDCSCLPLNSDGTITVPNASMLIQTTINGENLGENDFIICDQFTYYKEEKLRSKCGKYTINPNQLKQTKFIKCCSDINIVSVVRGSGSTLLAKLEHIWILLKLTTRFDEFYRNVAAYAMAKYNLSRILYGKFSIKYILGKYNNRFLTDLSNSRFCNLVTYFTDPNSTVYGYGKYFKFGTHHK